LVKTAGLNVTEKERFVSVLFAVNRTGAWTRFVVLRGPICSAGAGHGLTLRRAWMLVVIP